MSFTERDGHDSPQFKPLLEVGAESFDIARVVADKAYSSRANLELATAMGVEPLIPFRSNAKAVNSTGKRSEVWEKLFHFYSFKRDEFLAAYHARSNAESTFSSMKRVSGDTLRGKTLVAQTNELSVKVIAHNIVCLVHSIFALDVTPLDLHSKCGRCTQYHSPLSLSLRERVRGEG